MGMIYTQIYDVFSIMCLAWTVCVCVCVWVCWCVFPLAHSQCVFPQQQQLQAQHLSHAAHGPVALPPHPSGLQPPGIPPVTGTGSGLLALGALGSQPHLPVKDEKNHHDLEHRGENEPKHYSETKACFRKPS